MVHNSWCVLLFLALEDLLLPHACPRGQGVIVVATSSARRSVHSSTFNQDGVHVFFQSSGSSFLHELFLIIDLICRIYIRLAQFDELKLFYVGHYNFCEFLLFARCNARTLLLVVIKYNIYHIRIIDKTRADAGGYQNHHTIL